MNPRAVRMNTAHQPFRKDVSWNVGCDLICAFKPAAHARVQNLEP